MFAPTRLLALVLSTMALIASGSGAAWADEPVGWPEGEGRSTFESLLFFGGSTLALIVVITLFALLTARRNYVPPPPGDEVGQLDPHDHQPSH